MRRALIVLLLLAAAMAVVVDNETGCEKYSDHVICPQDSQISVGVKYTTDADCYSLQNEYGRLEEMGCYADAVLTEPLQYENCKMYVPFDSKDIRLDKINYNYKCSTEQLGKGQVVHIVGFQKDFEGCKTITEDKYYGEYSCSVKGEKYVMNGSIEYDGNYTVVLSSQEKQKITGLAAPLVALVVIVLLVYAAYAWTGRKK